MGPTGVVKEEIFFDGTKGYQKTFDDDGKVLATENITSLRSTPAAFPGGLPAWSRFLEQNLRVAPLIRNGALPGTYTVTVQFTVMEDGTINNISVRSGQAGYGAEEEAIRVMERSPKWTPAKRLNKSIKSVKFQPITFYIGN